MSKSLKIVVLGDEYDDALKDALIAVLQKNGAVGIDKSWAVGGSQEIETFKVTFNNEIVNIESETFVGLTIAGPSDIIEKLEQQVHEHITNKNEG